jgi:hypothetical protein
MYNGIIKCFNMRKFRNIIEDKEKIYREIEREEKLKNYTNRFKYVKNESGKKK